jgi:uncharacterized protein
MATARLCRPPFSSRPSRPCASPATGSYSDRRATVGYYLIGLKHPHRAVFNGIEWGTANVARSTLHRAQDLALEAMLLPEWYDVDDAETFSWLRDELAGRLDRFQGGGPAPATRAFLATASEGVR